MTLGKRPSVLTARQKRPRARAQNHVIPAPADRDGLVAWQFGRAREFRTWVEQIVRPGKQEARLDEQLMPVRSGDFASAGKLHEAEGVVSTVRVAGVRSIGDRLQ